MAVKCAPWHLRTPHMILENPLYLQWMGSQESQIWHCMVPRVIRAKMENKVANMVYEKYFLERELLCACMTQKFIADKLAVKSTAQISRCVTSMKEQGIIVIHQDSYGGRPIYVYELGKLGPKPEQEQLWHLFALKHKELAEKNLEDLL